MLLVDLVTATTVIFRPYNGRRNEKSLDRNEQIFRIFEKRQTAVTRKRIPSFDRLELEGLTSAITRCGHWTPPLNVEP
jgi:hypothetical protein